MVQFEFVGETYRLAFQHQIDPDWNAHLSHRLMELRSDGLHCMHCEEKFKREARIYPPGTRQARERSTTCTLYRRSKERPTHGVTEWTPVASAHSRLNVDAGDRFTRKGGRKASFHALIEDLLKRDLPGTNNLRELATAARKAFAQHGYQQWLKKQARNAEEGHVPQPEWESAEAKSKRAKGGAE